jgi:TPR repeat protein
MSRVDFFVSHASADREHATHLVDALEARGARCWIAPRDVPPGSDYREAIFDAVFNSDSMLLLFSKNADSSDHISREIFLAGEHKKTIIPLKLDDVVPSARLAYSLAGLHWIDFLDNRDETIEFILSQRNSKVAAPQERTPQPGPARNVEQQSESRPAVSEPGLVETQQLPLTRRKLLIPISIAASVVLAVIGWWLTRGVSDPAQVVDPRVSGLAAARCTELAGGMHDIPSDFESIDIENLDHEQAVPACREAVQYFPGDAALERQLARALIAAEQYEEAAQIIRPLALNGYAAAESNMGYLYLHGLGVEQDDEQSYLWTLKAARKDELHAQLLLAWLYLNGRGVERNEVEALNWYTRAAELGSADALNSLGVIYEQGLGEDKDLSRALEYYQSAAAENLAAAQANIGRFYEFGIGDLEQDYEEALKYYMQAASQNYANGQTNVGRMYASGRGVPEDRREAAVWYEMAAKQGDVTAQVNLGALYHGGLDSGPDYAMALTWYTAAAEQGNANAEFNLGLLYEYGLGVRRDYLIALEWYEKAAAQMHERAMDAVERLSKAMGSAAQELVFRGYRNPLSQVDEDSWGPVSDTDTARLVKHLRTLFPDAEELVESNVKIFERALSAYSDMRFLEIDLSKGEMHWYAYLVWGPDEFVPLNGTSSPLHALNARKKLDVYTRDSAAEYLYMFVNTLIAEEGRFLLVDDPGDVPFAESADPSQAVDLANLLVPLTFVGPPEWDEEAGRIEAFKFKATMLYGRRVFLVDLRFRPTGLVEMTDDKPLTEKLSVDTDDRAQHIILRSED